MRAGVETIRIMEAQGLLANADTVGQHLKAALEKVWRPSWPLAAVKARCAVGA